MKKLLLLFGLCLFLCGCKKEVKEYTADELCIIETEIEEEHDEKMSKLTKDEVKEQSAEILSKCYKDRGLKAGTTIQIRGKLWGADREHFMIYNEEESERIFCSREKKEAKYSDLDNDIFFLSGENVLVEGEMHDGIVYNAKILSPSITVPEFKNNMVEYQTRNPIKGEIIYGEVYMRKEIEKISTEEYLDLQYDNENDQLFWEKYFYKYSNIYLWNDAQTGVGLICSLDGPGIDVEAGDKVAFIGECMEYEGRRYIMADSYYVYK